MTDLFDAYINNATAFAIIHGILILACFWIWLFNAINLRKERQAFNAIKLRTEGQVLNNLKANGSPNGQSASSVSVITIANFAVELSKKGTAIDVETIARRLSRTLSSSDATLRALINGLIVVGLLGTLFNLWHLSPTFWNSLLDGNALQKDTAIGIAFAASFFGLLWALVLNLADNLLFRRRREVFVQDVAEYVALESIKQLPPTQEAAIVNALDQFIKNSEATIDDLKETSRRMIDDLKTKSDELTQNLIDQHDKSSNLTQTLIDQIDKSSESLNSQIDDSSKLLTSQFDKILRRWWRFFNDAVTKVKEEEERLAESTDKLINATNHVSATLERTTDTLQGYKELDALIAEVKTQSVNLVSQVTQQIGQLNEQTKITITEVSNLHARTVAEQSDETKRRLTDLMDRWHTKSAGILTPFGETIRKSGEDFSLNWQQLSKSLDGKIESSVGNWQTSLNAAVSEVKASLATINQQLKEGENLSAALSKSAEKLAQTAKNIPAVSEKTNNSDEVVRELIKKLDAQFYQSNKIAGQLLDKLDALPNQISQTIARGNKTNNRPAVQSSNTMPKQSAQTNVGNNNKKPSLFKRWFG